MEHTELKKETSIDWLMTQLYKKGFIKEIDGNEPIILMNKAKELQKQQIIDAWLKGVEDEGNPHGHTYLYGETDLAEQYYNEQFKNK